MLLKPGQFIRQNGIDSWILQADGIEHAHGRLKDPMWFIAGTGMQRRALQHDSTGIAIREARHACVFFAKTDTAREQHNRRAEIEAAKSTGEPRIGCCALAKLFSVGRGHGNA